MDEHTASELAYKRGYEDGKRDADISKTNGCEYCQQFDDPCGVPMIASEDSDPDRGIYLYNGFLCASGGEFCEAKVNFCPMCGRKLPEPPKGE